ncbi:zf-HC2 domain-containing protein [Actinomadura sp. WMMB 499]|uniref:zf-HC2 domain-containing protein n=1 Tax=Actinomadura sp. WMMB 499 TaxID=1219491 RepID=UPI00159DB302|nr:zf-HC2 domain-containing protein [Actinomadura sp. WMMB 499]
MSCLGERLTALVDGELGHDERERALAHLAACARCRAEAATLRSLKGRLRGLGSVPEPGADDLPTDDFLTRLRALGGDAAPAGPPPGPPVPPEPHEEPAAPGRAGRSGRPARPGRPRRSSVRPARPARAAAFAGPRDTRPAGHAAALARRRYLVMGAATLVLGLGTASYAAGGREAGPTVTPEFDRFAVEHALTSGDAPVSGQDPRPLGELDARSPRSSSPGGSPGTSPGAGAPGGATPSGPVASPVASVPIHAGP